MLLPSFTFSDVEMTNSHVCHLISLLNSALPPVPSRMALTTARTPCGCINLSESNCPHRRLSHAGACVRALPPPLEPDDAYSKSQITPSQTNTNTSEKNTENSGQNTPV